MSADEQGHTQIGWYVTQNGQVKKSPSAQSGKARECVWDEAQIETAVTNLRVLNIYN